MVDDGSLAQLAGRLRALREDIGLTLRELSRKVHVSDSSLSRYFAAQALPPWEVVAALADLAGADHVELRQFWESVSQARRRARWSEPRGAAGQGAGERIRPRQPEPARRAPTDDGRPCLGFFGGVVALVTLDPAAGIRDTAQLEIATVRAELAEAVAAIADLRAELATLAARAAAGAEIDRVGAEWGTTEGR